MVRAITTKIVFKLSVVHESKNRDSMRNTRKKKKKKYKFHSGIRTMATYITYTSEIFGGDVTNSKSNKY